jgi:16S rRNA (cytosine967-C5)-methyltransferase
MSSQQIDEATISPARGAAYQALLDVLRGRGFAIERLRELRDSGELDARDAGLAAEIALGGVRHLVTIEHILRAVAQLKPESLRCEVRAILYAATYQIVWMDRVPIFAVTDQAVRLAHRHVGGRAPALVNAVLRNLSRTVVARRAPWQRLDRTQVRVSWDQACVLAKPVFPQGNVEGVEKYVAAAAGERLARYRTLVKRYGPQKAEQVAWASQAVPPLVLQPNTLKADRKKFCEAARPAGSCAGTQFEVTDQAAFFAPSLHLADIPAFAEGLAYVQDVTAHAAACLVEARPGQRILDLCAAPGGKSVTLALQMNDSGEVIAVDKDARRLELVRQNVQRLGLRSVRVCTLSELENLRGDFDAVLVDAPCSNTGVIARRPEARLGLTGNKVASLVRVQRQLLKTAAGLVRKGGRLVYATCSLEPAENEEVVQWFLAQHDGWYLEKQVLRLPDWGPRLSQWQDGGYAARLVLSA